MAFMVGTVAGILSGLLGVGGGIVMVPALVLLLDLPQHRAHATSLAAIVPVAAVGAVLFTVEGRVNFRLAALLALGGIVGAPAGVRLLTRTPEPLLRAVFVLAVLVAGTRLLVGS